MKKLLIVGTGELGSAIINSLQSHPTFKSSSNSYSITTTSRPSTLSSPSPTTLAKLTTYRENGIAILPLDIETSTLSDLTSTFTSFDTIIHAGGMTIRPGTQMKVTRAVLASASSFSSSSSTPSSSAGPRKLYIPWQFGLDYDAIGPDSGNGLFREQCEIRDLLRAQSTVDWVIVSNGIFMSFAFSSAWGLVEPSHSETEKHDDDIDNDHKNEGNELVVRALGSPDTNQAFTTAEDIATCTTELVLADPGVRGKAVYIAGDVLSYGEFVKVVERVSGKKVRREVWTTEELQRKMEAKPEDKLRQYHVVFSKGVGTAWNMKETYNVQKGIGMTGVETWLGENRGILVDV